MKRSIIKCGIVGIAVMTIVPVTVLSQGTVADYERAEGLRSMVSGLVYDSIADNGWIPESNRFWYRNSSREGKEFILVDAERRRSGPAFDHARLAM